VSWAVPREERDECKDMRFVFYISATVTKLIVVTQRNRAIIKHKALVRNKLSKLPFES
jgi:hypothetical protein